MTVLSANVTDSGHTHTYEDRHLESALSTLIVEGEYAMVGSNYGYTYRRSGIGTTRTTNSGNASLTDSGHTHTVSGTLPNLAHNHPLSVSVTNQTTGGTGTLGQASSHSILNPYFVVNFIILAKVPRVS